MPSTSAAADYGSHHRRRRRRRSYDDDEEEGLPTWKLGMVVAVAVVCFGVLYPTMFHPMLVSFFSKGQPQQNTRQQAPIHPGKNGPSTRNPGGPRPGIHPAMGMAPQGEQPSGSGKGMFTWMLPLYTVGVVIFLVYTLFIKKKKKSRRSRYSKHDDYDTESEVEEERNGRMGRKQLHDLQTRLKETELAMSKILQQMETVSQSEQVVGTSSNLMTQSDAKTDEAEENLQSKEGYVRDLETALRQFQELSESYDKGQGMSAERRHYGDDTDEDESEEEDRSSLDDEFDEEEEEEQDHSEELEVEAEEEPESVDKEDSEADVPEEPEPAPVEVEEHQPRKKRVRRRQRRT